LGIFKTYILAGSIIHTDGWAPYVRVCEELGFEHKTVMHKYYFKDPITGTHTNTIEGVNNGMKHLIKPRNRVEKNIDNCLHYFIWRKTSKKHIWKSFLLALQDVMFIS
jgi:hypothetical protein